MNVFVSYRRDDTAPYAGPLADALSARFGGDHVMNSDGSSVTSISPKRPDDIRAFLVAAVAALVGAAPVGLLRSPERQRAASG
jgi:hypothetical protein